MSKTGDNYDPKLVSISKLPIFGSRVERNRSEYKTVSPRYYQVVDRNFGTTHSFLIQVFDSDVDVDDDSESKAGVVVQLVLAPTKLPKRVAAVSQLSIKFNHPQARSRLKGAYAAVNFRRPLVYGGLKKLNITNFRKLPVWFTSPLEGKFCRLRSMLTDKKYVFLGPQKQIPEAKDFVLSVYYPSWDEKSFVSYYMINRVYAAYQKYVFVSDEDEAEAQRLLNSFPKALRSKFRSLRKRELTKILMSSRPGSEVELPPSISKLVVNSGCSISSIRSYLRFKLNTEAAW